MKFGYKAIGILLFLPVLFPAQIRAAETALYKQLVQSAKAEGEVEYWSPMNEEPANKILGSIFPEVRHQRPNLCAGSRPEFNSAI